MYPICLDDASDQMNIERRARVEGMLDENGVKPLVGVRKNQFMALKCYLKGDG